MEESRWTEGKIGRGGDQAGGGGLGKGGAWQNA